MACFENDNNFVLKKLKNIGDCKKADLHIENQVVYVFKYSNLRVTRTYQLAISSQDSYENCESDVADQDTEKENISFSKEEEELNIFDCENDSTGIEELT